jgi:hypothetical protein
MEEKVKLNNVATCESCGKVVKELIERRTNLGIIYICLDCKRENIMPGDTTYGKTIISEKKVRIC